MSSIVRSFFVLAIASAIGLSASIAFAQPQVGIPENEKIGVIIGLKTEPEAAAAAQADAAQQISDLGGEVNHRYTIIPAVSAELPPQAIADLLNDPAIAFVELDGEVQALVETIPWGIDRIRALPNPNNGDAIEYTGGAGIVVA
ncbi:MAG: hypothetical protein VX500_09780, partial [Planctomycetota bacterium]|nr:hypothetical protein [Planctomycetota bacterium]